MSAISSLPVEVWQAILRSAVEVPLFLDPDAFEGVLSSRRFHASKSPLNDEDPYWRAEKTRNQMQLVSKSWDSFLRQFEHRFIRILDIRHGNVAPQKLETAIRVCFSKYDCECTEFCTSGSFHDFILGTLEQVGSMAVEIADTRETRILPQTLCSPKFKNTKTLVSSHYVYKYPLDALVRALPSLRHFYSAEDHGTPDIIFVEGLLSPTLVTLSFFIMPRRGYDQVKLELPSLRHLRINLYRRTATVEFIKGVVLNILRVVGSQLRSFHLNFVPHGNETLEEFWELCPKLESFRTAFSLVSPPLSHPIHTLQLHRVEQMEVLQQIHEWPNLRRIVLEFKWNYVDFRGRDIFVPSRDGLRVKDWEGLILDEHYNPG